MHFRSIVLQFPLFSRLILPTDGTTTPLYRKLDVPPELRRALPTAAALFVMHGTEARTTNHRWNVYFTAGLDPYLRQTGYNALVSGTGIAANGVVRATDYTDTTKFLPDADFYVASWNADLTAIETAFTSAVLAVVLRS